MSAGEEIEAYHNLGLGVDSFVVFFRCIRVFVGLLRLLGILSGCRYILLDQRLVEEHGVELQLDPRLKHGCADGPDDPSRDVHDGVRDEQAECEEPTPGGVRSRRV